MCIRDRLSVSCYTKTATVYYIHASLELKQLHMVRGTMPLLGKWSEQNAPLRLCERERKREREREQVRESEKMSG